MSVTDQKTLMKYLSSYAEPEARAALPELPYFRHVLVVPVFDESLSAIEKVLAAGCDRSSLTVLVFNVPESAAPAARARTQESLNELLARYAFTECGDGVFVVSFQDGQSLLVLDRVSDGKSLPAKQGVGLARKLGLDIALALSWRQQLSGKPMPAWLHCSDADVVFPLNYFDIAEPKVGQVASVYDFEHVAEPGWEVTTKLYDFRLRYYVAALAWAGSTYAFHTIGSTLAVTPQAYAIVRGMPRRSGGEDFYFLNKLAKIGTVRSLEAPRLQIAGRPSDRVPFGTGPALSKIADLDDPIRDYRLYHPRCFALLSVLLAKVKTLSQALMSKRISSDINVGTHLTERCREALDDSQFAALQSALASLGIERFWKHLQGQSGQNLETAFNAWFDAFITLKFVHHLRDQVYPNLALSELSKEALWLPPALKDELEGLLQTR